MRRSTLLFLLGLVLSPFLLWRACAMVDARRFQGEGAVAPDEPLQRVAHGAPFLHGAVWVTPKAEFSATARVLSAHDYRRDVDGDIVPVDLALGWGPLSDAALVLQMHIGQHSRYLSWHAPSGFPLSGQTIIRSSANMHMVPATDEIRAQLLRLRRGQVVAFSGALVDISGGALSWHSSMSREDSGSYACEVVFTETLRVIAQ